MRERLRLGGKTAPAYGELIGILGLIVLLALFLAISWRKWPDPIIDFGRELYLPWRLSQGAVLFRDVDDVYGPLSQYFNAALFTLFGPSLMVLVAANLLIFTGILALTYSLFRQAWGVGAAFVSVAIFIAVFGFSQFEAGNYNYATPYSEETTHGVFVCLLLVVILVRWIEDGTLAASFLAGLLFGVTWVLKPEAMLAGGLLVAAAIALKYRAGVRPGPRHRAAMTAGALLPSLIFLGYFAKFMPFPEAVSAAGRAWWNATTTTRFSGYDLQLNFLGLDEPWQHFLEQAFATLWAFLLLAIIAATGRFVDSMQQRGLRFLAVGGLIVVLFWLALHRIHWIYTGRCLPGLMLIYLGICLWHADASSQISRAQLTRWLLAVLATAFLARMFFHARIYQYGYYQAAFAAILVPAILLGEGPGWLRVGRKGASAIAAGMLALILPGVIILIAHSAQVLAKKTFPIGVGADRFYAFPPSIDVTGEYVETVSDVLRKDDPHETLLVLPEGVMINYLARLPSPIAPYCYFAMATADGREDAIVQALQRHPPDVVVIISRPLLEYGMTRYGAKRNEGKQILAWVTRNYQIEVSKGGSPLDYNRRGVIVLVRRTGS
jgi:hypothetical protein